MPRSAAARRALSGSREAMATTCDHSLRCMAGITLTVAILATPRTPQRTLAGIARVSHSGGWGRRCRADALVRAGRPRPAGLRNEEADQGVGRGPGRPPHSVFINFGGPQALRRSLPVAARFVAAHQMYSLASFRRS